MVYLELFNLVSVMIKYKDLDELPKKLVKHAIKLGASDSAVSLDISSSSMIRFSNNEISIFESSKEVSLTVYVACKERRAISSFTDLSPDSIERAVSKLVSIAKLSEPSDVYAPLPKGPFRYDKRLLKIGRVSLDPENLAKYIEVAINSALSSGASRVAGTLICDKSRKILATSGDVEAEYSSSSIEISVRAFADGDASGQFVSIATDESDFKPDIAGSMAGEVARISKDPVEIDPGNYDVVLGPMIFSDIIEEVAYASSAFYVDAGISFLTNKLGEFVASDVLTLSDDPTIPETYGAAPFDDEGLPTKRKNIIEAGMLKTYLHNSTTAKRNMTESTANAGIIVPVPLNLIVKDGKKDHEKIISQIDEGLCVLNNWYLRYSNYRSGDFSTVLRDGIFLIRNGCVERSVKGLRMSDNMLRFLSSIEELSSDRYWIKWWEVETPVYAPWALVRNVRFTKSTL